MEKLSLDTRIEHMLGRFNAKDLAFFNLAEQDVDKAITLKSKVDKVLSLMTKYDSLNKLVLEFYIKGDDQKIRCKNVLGNNISNKIKYIGKSITSGIVPETLASGISIEETIDEETGSRKEFAESNNLIKSLYYPINGTAVLVASKRDYTSRFSKKQLDLLKYSIETIISKALISSTKYKQLLTLATKDGLTGLYNRRYFEEKLEQSVKLYNRVGKLSLGLILIDIDYFKSVNDTYGHRIGDKVLVDISNTINKTVRDYDTVARYGGEEIVVLLQGTSKRKAISLAKRISAEIKIYSQKNPQYNIKLDNGKMWPLSVSIGIAAIPNDTDNKESLVKMTDDLLYKSKNTGRARVSWYEN